MIFKKQNSFRIHLFLLVITTMVLPLVISCGLTANRDAGTTLLVEEVDPADTNGNGIPDTEENSGQTIPGYTVDGHHPMFAAKLGVPVSSVSMGSVDPDPTGLSACTDYDGDGIPNDHEITSNMYVADYPQIVTRVAPPITMEIRVDEESEIENYTQTVTDRDVKNTITNSMEDKHYASAQQKTTPYVTKDSLNESGSHANSFGYTNSDSYANKDKIEVGGQYSAYQGTSVAFNFGKEKERSKTTSRSQNASIEDSFATGTMSEKTVFQDVDYVDNMDKNGVEFTSQTVENMSTNYRSNKEIHSSEKVGPNAGYVRASLFLKNLTVNMPVKISNLVCTLSFRTPSGTYLPVKTFTYRNEDFSEFTKDVYGGEELGPYTVEIKDLGTREVKLALANGYMPQIHVVSYDMTPVKNSNYRPGVENLKIVEETAKGRTALIKLIGSNARETHRVAAFDVENSATGRISPGISLKKALFLALRDNIGDGESWTLDKDGVQLTVPDSGLKWKAGVADKNNYKFSGNLSGNSWRNFETYVKSYEKDGETHRIETIKRIGLLSKYNPFSKDDNTGYNPNELLSRDELLKMKFWVIFHNGRYFEGDLNDPIWAGDRYEVVCMDMFDFNEHITSYVYAPFQSGDRFYLDTRWNAVSEEEGEFARAIYLGKILTDDVIQLELNLLESRYLFPREESADGFGEPEQAGYGSIYYNYNYTFEPVTEILNGIPDKFTYAASGGVNSLYVNINQTSNAKSYRIKFTEMKPPAGHSAHTWTVSVSRADIEANSLVCINSKTLDINGAEVGYISGIPEASEGGEVKSYKVDVYANGKLNNVNVYTKGDSQSNIAYVAEPDPDTLLPKAFSFSANGTTDSIDIQILGSEDAEYYLIRCNGPYNYYPEGSVPSVEIVGNAGYNSIDFSKHTNLRPSFTDMEARFFETGVYTVEVYAVNKNNAATASACDEFNTPGNCVRAGNDTVFAEVLFDRYAKQRKYEPRVNDELLNMSAVDIEVNFNDGSGWFKLQLVDPFEYGAQDDDQSKVIDCYYSSHMELDTQKFVIRFEAPKGKYGLPNVFFGQRTETKVFLRTIPKTKYRDSFWPVIAMNELTGDPVARTNYDDGNLYLDFNFNNNNFDITDLWTSSGMTDASMLEDAADNGYVNNFYDNSKQCLFAKSTGDTNIYDDFFFSPKEHKVFVVKAMVDMEGTVQTPYRPGPPSFTTLPPLPDSWNTGNSFNGYTWDYIQVNDIISETATSYTVYWTECPDGTCPQNFASVTDWIDVKPATLDPETKKYQKRIMELTSGSSYMIAVTATNRYGASEPTVVKNITVPLKPAGTPEKPGYPVGALYSDDTGIHCTGLVSLNAFTFTGIWKLESQDDLPPNWKPFDIFEFAENLGTWNFQIPQTVINTALDEFGYVYADPTGTMRDNKVMLRIKAINSDGLKSESLNVTVEPVYCKFVPSEAITNANDNSPIAIAYGEFGRNLTKKNGQPLIIGGDFAYDFPLNNIFDNEVSGPFEMGKVLRIVIEGLNVTDTDGLGLTPIAKNFSQGLTSPPAGQIYIDPMTRQFVLPRPIYWSRCDEATESLTSLSTAATIRDYLPTHSTNMTYVTYPDGKFMKGIKVNNKTGTEQKLFIYPIGDTPCPVKGTFSFWYKVDKLSGVSSVIVFSFNGYSSEHNNFSIYISNGELKLYWCLLRLDGNTQISVQRNMNTDWPATSYQHMYMVWDFTGPFIKVYIDGILIIEATPAVSAFSRPPVLSFEGYGTKSLISIDNIKTWDRVVGDPNSNYSAWEFNNGVEGGLDYLYGPDGYAPDLVNGSSVGYYYKPQ